MNMKKYKFRLILPILTLIWCAVLSFCCILDDYKISYVCMYCFDSVACVIAFFIGFLVDTYN